MSIKKSVPLKSYSSMKRKNLKDSDDFWHRKKIDFESQNFAILDNFYSTDHKT